MATTFSIVRHGETHWNVAGILQGHNDSLLTPKGNQQMEHLAKQLKAQQFHLFYSSTLGRALTSAAILNNTLQLPLAFQPFLKERAFGILEGLTPKQLTQQHPQAYLKIKEGDTQYKIPKGESYLEFTQRIEDGFEKLARIHPNKHILVLSHGGVIECILRKLKGLPQGQAYQTIVENSSVTSIKILENKWELC